MLTTFNIFCRKNIATYLKLISIIVACINIMAFIEVAPRIHHTVEISNRCKSDVKNFKINYGDHVFPAKNGERLGFMAGGAYSITMLIPKNSYISWSEHKAFHRVSVPIQSLIKIKEINGDKFKLVFHVCNEKLVVFLDKRVERFTYKRRQLWPQPSKLASK